MRRRWRRNFRPLPTAGGTPFSVSASVCFCFNLPVSVSCSMSSSGCCSLRIRSRTLASLDACRKEVRCMEANRICIVPKLTTAPPDTACKSINTNHIQCLDQSLAAHLSASLDRLQQLRHGGQQEQQRQSQSNQAHPARSFTPPSVLSPGIKGMPPLSLVSLGPISNFSCSWQTDRWACQMILILGVGRRSKC